jgi:Zn-dependent protease with chaperone function
MGAIPEGYPYSYFGKPSNEYNSLIKKIKNDLENDYPALKSLIIKSEITVYIGTYSRTLNIDNAQMQPSFSNKNIYYIIIDSDFFKSLNDDEKLATLGHETGHLPLMIKVVNGLITWPLNRRDHVNSEIEADTIAARYAGANAVITLLKKANWTYELRMDSLNKIKNR